MDAVGSMRLNNDADLQPPLPGGRNRNAVRPLALPASSTRGECCCDQVCRVAAEIASFVRNLFVWLYEIFTCKTPEFKPLPAVAVQPAPIELFHAPDVSSLLERHLRMHNLSKTLQASPNDQIGIFIGCKLGEEVIHTIRETAPLQDLQRIGNTVYETIFKALRNTTQPANALLQITTLLQPVIKQTGVVRVNTYQKSAPTPLDMNAHVIEITQENWGKYVGPYLAKQQA